MLAAFDWVQVVGVVCVVCPTTCDGWVECSHSSQRDIPGDPWCAAHGARQILRKHWLESNVSGCVGEV